MSRIFISYKRVDKDKIFKIKEQIEAALGEKCWIDLDGIESDAVFANKIIVAINNSEVFLFMYSKAHMKISDYENDWTVRELNFAQMQKKRIVFINIDGSELTDWFKLFFGTRQQVDATSNDAIIKLLEDMSFWLNTPKLQLEKINDVINKGHFINRKKIILYFLSVCVPILSFIIYRVYEKITDKTDDLIISKTNEYINKVPLFQREVDSTKTICFDVYGVEFRMKFVEKGALYLGATPEQTDSVRADEGVGYDLRGHRVTISEDFWIGETEVTQRLWEAVMGRGNNPSQFSGPDLPVEKINIRDCKDFIKKLSEMKGVQFDLPTEAEWEYAARGGVNFVGNNYSGSDTLYTVAWHYLNSGKRPHPVAQLKPNELGIYDMSGNVYEWCEDYANRSFYKDNMINPCDTVPSDNRHLRIIRGGSWHSSTTSSCRVAFREYMSEDARASSLGLRIVLRTSDSR